MAESRSFGTNRSKRFRNRKSAKSSSGTCSAISVRTLSLQLQGTDLWEPPKDEETNNWTLPSWPELVAESNEMSVKPPRFERRHRGGRTGVHPLKPTKSDPLSKGKQNLSKDASPSWASIARSGVSSQPACARMAKFKEEDPWATPHTEHTSDKPSKRKADIENVDNAIFKSPWLLRPGHCWVKKASEQKKRKNKICKLALEILIKCTPRDAASRLSLASTCQSLLYAVSSMHTVWNIENGELSGHENGHLSPTPTLIITSDFCDYEEVYLRSQRARLMTISLNHHASTIRILELYRVPFMEVSYVQSLLPRLTALQRLGVYSCHLISFSHTILLLQAFSSGLGNRRNCVDLDFYPRRYHDKVFYRPQANIGCMLPHLVNIAIVVQDLGIPLFNKGGAFLRFLNQPILRLQGEKSKNGAGSRLLDKTIAYSKTKDWDDDLANWMKRQEWADWSKTTAPGSNFRKLWKCFKCRAYLHGVFFSKSQHKKDDDGRECLGCLVEEYRMEEENSEARLGVLYRASRFWYNGPGKLDKSSYKWEELVEKARLANGEHFKHLHAPHQAPDTILDKDGNVVVQPTVGGVDPVKITFEEYLQTNSKHWLDRYQRMQNNKPRGRHRKQQGGTNEA